jgi:long-chain acyl-CoA synthetase
VALAKGLIAAGIEPGDRVALISRDPLRVDADRLRDLGIGAVTVPIYETSSPSRSSGS